MGTSSGPTPASIPESVQSNVLHPLGLPPAPPTDLINMTEAESADISHTSEKHGASDGLHKATNEVVLENLNADLKALKKYNSVEFLKRQHEEFRPAFVCRGLLLPFQVDDTETKFILKAYERAFKGQAPKLLNSFDATINLRNMPMDFWKHSLDDFMKQHIVVSNDWDDKAGRPAVYVQCLPYEIGPTYPEGIQYLRGECDASYDLHTHFGAIANAIWNKTDLLWYEICRGFRFNSILHAEAHAAYLCLKRGIVLTPYFSMYVDNLDIHKILRAGYRSREGTDDPIFDLLPFMRTYFLRFSPHWVNRELLKLVDGLMRNKNPNSDRQWAADLLSEFQEVLKGVPIFSYDGDFRHNTLTDEVLKSPMYLYEDTCYVEAKEGEFFETVKHVINAFQPKRLRIIAKEGDTVVDDLVKLYGKKVDYIAKSPNWTDVDFSVDEAPKVLCLCLDSEIYQKCSFEDRHAMTVFMIKPEEKGGSHLENVPELSVISRISYYTDREDIAEDMVKWKRLVNKGVGTMTPKIGDDVKIYYTLLHNGKEIESNRDSEVPHVFCLGEGMFYGWDSAIASMNRKERSIFTVPPILGYAKVGSPPRIPPHATPVGCRGS